MNINDIGSVKTGDMKTEFENTVHRLISALSDARMNTEAYRNKLDKFDKFILESEQSVPKSYEGNLPIEESPDTLLFNLNSLVSELELINRRNSEIISHFNSLI